MKRHAMYIYTVIMHNSARDWDECLMHVPVVSPAGAATVATHAWTRLHTHPVASSIASFNDTISTISTTQLFICISCSHQIILMGHAQQLFCPSLKQQQACLVNYQVLSPQATLLLFLVSKLPCKCDVHGPHSQINTELFSSYGDCPAFWFFLPAKHTAHLLSCTLATKQAMRFVGVVNFCAYWVLSAYFLVVLEISVCAY